MQSKSKCPKCDCSRYVLSGMDICSDDNYTKNMVCRKCRNEWSELFPLLTDSNKYGWAWDNATKTMKPLHRWVWEKANGEVLTSVDSIHHKNQKKGDNRPSNLEKISCYEHTPQMHDRSVSCLKCNHTWIPKPFKPRMCPKCKSVYWNKNRDTKL